MHSGSNVREKGMRERKNEIWVKGVREKNKWNLRGIGVSERKSEKNRIKYEVKLMCKYEVRKQGREKDWGREKELRWW